MALTYFGTTSWAQCAPEEWTLSDFGLDTLIVPVSGSETTRVSYQSGLTKWAASSIDANMFLSSWSAAGGSKQYPMIHLQYIGCKGGTLPTTRSSNSYSLQTATSKTSAGQAEFQFRVPTTRWDWITSTKPGDTPTYTTMDTTSSPLTAGNLIGWHITTADGTTGLVDYATFVTLYNALTLTVLVADYITEPLVPNHYWRCTSTVVRTLLGN